MLGLDRVGKYDALRECRSRMMPNCNYAIFIYAFFERGSAVIAQLGERKTEDLKVSGSIPDCGSCFDKSTFYENNMFAFDY